MTVHKKINWLKLIVLGSTCAFVIAISTIIYINAKLKNLTKTPKAFIKLSKNIPDLRLENVHYEKTGNGKTEWEMDAKVAHHFQGKDLLTLDKVKMIYYGAKKRTVMITGKQGRIKPSTKDVELIGNVLIKSGDGYRLYTNYLKYSSKTSLITTNDHVLIKGKKFDVTGVGMKMNIKKDRLSILRAVQTTIKGNFFKESIPGLGF